jgi:hypothetical protein
VLAISFNNSFKPALFLFLLGVDTVFSLFHYAFLFLRIFDRRVGKGPSLGWFRDAIAVRVQSLLKWGLDAWFINKNGVQS